MQAVFNPPVATDDVQEIGGAGGQARDVVVNLHFPALTEPAVDTMATSLEAYRGAVELRTVGITGGLVVANFVIPVEQATTPFTQSRRTVQEKYL